MEFLRLVEETKKLDEDIKKETEEFNLKIKEKVETYKSKKKEIEKYLEKYINSLEYEYREIEVETNTAPCEKSRKIDAYYPFLKLEDFYEIEEIRFLYQDDLDDYCNLGFNREYILYQKDNKIEIKVRENSKMNSYKKGTNEQWNSDYMYNFREKFIWISASRDLRYEIEIGEMKFEFYRQFDVSKI